VVIVRHVFNDGRTILSFYGHLDPPSVVLNVGDCVERGQQVGEIGKPRGRPHLHFEIRHHLPARPVPATGRSIQLWRVGNRRASTSGTIA
ncbi:MAG TPA: M23 family metallopeptidase, partial [Anaerolineae bacterium]|nr:M23 family metallopeptidase [Anaerolineae bacterium]